MSIVHHLIRDSCIVLIREGHECTPSANCAAIISSFQVEVFVTI